MRKTWLILWTILILYTLYYLFTQFRSVITLTDVLFADVDPLVFMAFNLLGIIPLGFLLVVIKHQAPRNTYKNIGLSLGFVSGAFALIPTILSMRLGEGKQNIFIRIGALTGIILSISLFFYGFSSGSLRTYGALFMQDALVHIMTIDLVFLYVFSISTMKSISSRWWLACIPFFGFFYLIYE